MKTDGRKYLLIVDTVDAAAVDSIRLKTKFVDRKRCIITQKLIKKYIIISRDGMHFR